MSQVRPSLLDTLERVELCGRAESQSVELRKDIPHPVRAFLAAPKFREGSRVVVFLRLHKATQIVRIVRAAKLICVRHTVSPIAEHSPITCLPPHHHTRLCLREPRNTAYPTW